MNQKDWTDWLVAIFLVAITATLLTVIWVNLHSVAMVGTAGGVISGLLGAYRWFAITDDKRPDANGR